METYTFLRGFADSWMLLALFLFFAYVVVRVFLPRYREVHRDAADSIFRHDDDAPAPDRKEA